MSNFTLNQAWRVQGLSATDKLVLISLADQSNDEGVCWPSATSLERRTGLSRRAVFYAIDRLEAGGHLTRTQRTGRSTYYTVHPRDGATSACGALVQEVHPTSARGAPITINEPSISTGGGKRPSKRPPADFEITPELRLWASQNAPGVNIEAETAAFLDYTFATAKTDWPATWRNWMRKARPTTTPATTTRRPANRFEAATAKLQARIAARAALPSPETSP